MLNKRFSTVIQTRIDQKTKPLGSLGLVEDVAFQLALIQSQGREEAVTDIRIKKPTMLVFAGDHGIADENVSIAPSEVTAQMVMNFLSGGAAINCFCRVNNIAFKVVDCGILCPVDSESDQLILQRLGKRTKNFANQKAMELDTVNKGLDFGASIVNNVIAKGSNLLMFGEMGIGNTSSAAAILSAISGKDAHACVGTGTGINEDQLKAKVALVTKGVVRCNGQSTKAILSEVGGYEIVQMVGGFLEAAKQNVPVLVDGFIVSIAAYAAIQLNPECREWMIFAHKSEEQGHQLVLSELNVQPLLDLGLRLGEGTGAALALPILLAAAEFYNNMASFESAGVTV
ncbi:nicotinate-nucleotide--dimethylbenzimidazole phosphoribosyltransferase [Vibrio sp. F74]|uniref:nicotinate-nucleotide--dimethylbenzimidazole phosphoribosyltransferase n=1 Tax=Vibrio sp. F74 TaxID=700020 RepID=UPI0035F58B71